MGYDFDKSLGKLTQQVSKNLGKNLEQRFIDNGFLLKSEDWSILSMLHKYKKQSQRDISTFMALDKVKIKRIIDRLENNELVTREESTTDKRFNTIRLTPKGKGVYKKAVKYAEQVILESTKNIPDEDINTCLNVLELIKENLIKEN